MASQPTFQFRMKDLLWAVCLFSTVAGIGVAVRRLGELSERRQVAYAAHDILVAIGVSAALSCFVAGIVRLVAPKFWMRELHLSATLIAVSLGTGMACIKSLHPVPGWAPLAAMALFVASGISLGAGIGAFFGKPIWVGFGYFICLLFIVGMYLAARYSLQ